MLNFGFVVVLLSLLTWSCNQEKALKQDNTNNRREGGISTEKKLINQAQQINPYPVSESESQFFKKNDLAAGSIKTSHIQLTFAQNAISIEDGVTLAIVSGEVISKPEGIEDKFTDLKSKLALASTEQKISFKGGLSLTVITESGPVVPNSTVEVCKPFVFEASEGPKVLFVSLAGEYSLLSDDAVSIDTDKGVCTLTNSLNGVFLYLGFTAGQTTDPSTDPTTVDNTNTDSQNNVDADTGSEDDGLTPPQVEPLSLSIALHPDQQTTTTALPVKFKVTFSKAIKDNSFTASHITQAGAASGITWQVDPMADNPREFILSVVSATGSGTIIPTIAANLITDTEEQKNQAFDLREHTVYLHHAMQVDLTLAQNQELYRYNPFSIQISFTNDAGEPWPQAESFTLSQNNDPANAQGDPGFNPLTPLAQTIEFDAEETQKSINVVLASAQTTTFSIKLTGSDAELGTLGISLNEPSSHNELGEGTAESPYLLYSPAQMKSLLERSGTVTEHYKLMDDIDLTGINRDAYPTISEENGVYSHSFEGILDGNGKTLSNFSLSLPSRNNVALFPIARGATIKNLTLDGFQVEGGSTVALLIAQVNNSITLDNITVNYPSNPDSTRMLKGTSYVGGLIGRKFLVDEDLVTRTYADGHSLPGVVSAFSEISNITLINPEIEASTQVMGALAGQFMNANMSNIQITGLDLHSTEGKNIGGVAGSCYHCRIDRSQVAGAITRTGTSAAKNIFGGIVGYFWSSVITNTSSDVDYSTAYTGAAEDAGDRQIGGITGIATHSSYIYACKASGDLSGGNQIGGITGLLNFSSTIAASYATGNITANGGSPGGSTDGIGGLVGGMYNHSHVYQSYSTGTIDGGSYSHYNGGLFGYVQQSTIMDNFTYSTVQNGETPSDNERIGHSILGNFTTRNYFSDNTCTSCNTTNPVDFTDSFASVSEVQKSLDQLQNLPTASTDPFPITAWDGWDDPTDATDDGGLLDIDAWVFEDGSFPKLWFEGNAAEPAPALAGSGTEQDPYLVAAANLQQVNNPRFVGKHFRITHSSDTFTISDQLSAKGLVFSGVLDFDTPDHGVLKLNGGGASLLDGNTGQKGLFQYLPYGSHIKNVQIENLSFINAGQFSGILASSIHSGENITITATASISSTTTNIGGVAAFARGSFFAFDKPHLLKISSAADVNTSQYSGGLFFDTDLVNIEQASYSGTLTTTLSSGVGGLVGRMRAGSLYKSFNSGTISGGEAEGNSIGGLIGLAMPNHNRLLQVFDSYNSGSVTSNDTASASIVSAGGIIGKISASKSGSTVGDVQLNNTYNSGTINGEVYTGGLVGNLTTGDLSIHNSFNAGVINTGTCGHVIAYDSTVDTTIDVDANYYDSENLAACAGVSDGTGVTPQADLLDSSHAVYSNWDFTDIWQSDHSNWPYHK